MRSFRKKCCKSARGVRDRPPLPVSRCLKETRGTFAVQAVRERVLLEVATQPSVGTLRTKKKPFQRPQAVSAKTRGERSGSQSLCQDLSQWDHRIQEG